MVQLSDTHLSARHGHFVANWRRVLERLRADPPDLVVTTGDISVDGADSRDDLVFAAAQLDRLPAPWRAVPGNHDIGEEPEALAQGQPADAERHARWLDVVGDDHWALPVEDWLLVGIDCLLYGTGRPAEAEQHRWLEKTIAGADGPVGLFLHKPLLVGLDDEHDPDPVLTVDRAGRGPLLDLVAGSPVRFVASGHLHQHRRTRRDGVDHVWAPSCAFAVEPLAGGAPRLGYLEWRFTGDEVDVAMVELPELERHDLRALYDHGAYGSLREAPPAPPDPRDLADAWR